MGGGERERVSETERERDRETDRQTDRQTDTERDSERARVRERERDTLSANNTGMKHSITHLFAFSSRWISQTQVKNTPTSSGDASNKAVTKIDPSPSGRHHHMLLYPHHHPASPHPRTHPYTTTSVCATCATGLWDWIMGTVWATNNGVFSSPKSQETSALHKQDIFTVVT